MNVDISGSGWQERGSVLLMLLIAVTLMGLAAGIAGTSWRTISQRAKEADLLWKGNQIRQAIGQYYEGASQSTTGPKKLPTELSALLRDPRYLEHRQYLRQLYVDPMTGGEWQLIKDQSGGIVGVKSRSLKKPFKQDGFAEENKSFAGTSAYSEWHFIHPIKGTVIVPNTDTPNN